MDSGAILVTVSAAVALLAAFVLRTRLAPPVVAGVLAVAGAGIGVGGMLLQEDPPAWEAVVAVVTLIVVVPAHVRIVLGPFGPPRRDA